MNGFAAHPPSEPEPTNSSRSKGTNNKKPVLTLGSIIDPGPVTDPIPDAEVT